MEPVSTAVAVASLLSSAKNLFGGGGGKVSSVHQGWRVQGTLTRDGLTGTNTAWDQLGNTWGGAVEASSYYAPIFAEYLGNSDIAIPVDLTVSASEGYNAGVVRQLREAFQALDLEAPSWNPTAPAPVMQTAPVSSNTPTEPAPVSRFDLNLQAPATAPVSISAPAPITTLEDSGWSSFWNQLFPTIPANNATMPSANVIPLSLQQRPANPGGGSTVLASSTAPAAQPLNLNTLAVLAVGAYVLVKLLNADE